MCDHCRGHHLRSMTDAGRPGSLPKIAESLRSAGAEGLLISGGCDPFGRIPFIGRVEELALVRRTGLLINLHTGLLDEAEARALVGIGADCYSVDIVQDRRTISDLLHLDDGPEAYVTTLEALFSAGAARVVPHICVSLQGDEIGGEMASIDLASKHPISALVLLWHIPTQGTPLHGAPISSEDAFLDVVRYAKRVLTCPVLLGCMRPRGRVELELETIRMGVAGMALPAPETLRRIRQEGYNVRRSERCCALHE
jgi:uncharacterized radical SAM superfamily protein